LEKAEQNSVRYESKRRMCMNRRQGVETYSNDVETGTHTSVPRIKVGKYLFIGQPASGIEAA
jgi:hypothetical protein